VQLTLRTICLIIAVVLFLLYAFGVKLGDISILGLGFTFFALAFLVPETNLSGRR
jgi:hypothetical protein